MGAHNPVIAATSIKPTSAAYGRAYQEHQAAKYRDRANNHWKTRIALAEDLLERFVMPRLAGRAPASIVSVDVGCSIGTFAIEMARRGFRSIGIDLDARALEIAQVLATEEG